MATATRRDIVSLIPELEDHSVVEILGMGATVAEIDAALVALAGDDESLVGIEHRAGDRLHRLLAILSRSGIEPEEDPGT